MNYKFLISAVIVSLAAYFSPFTPVAHAQIPQNTIIACDKVSETEFHSLRPYQTNTKCTSQVDKYATFCGNDLTLKDTVTVNYPGDERYLTRPCTTVGNKVTCNYSVHVGVSPKKTITINLDGAELPIVGRTQDDVINSQNPTETLTAADKVNNYVSWYLNGTTSKAEYPFSMEVVDYSGPINKLLPQEVAQQQRAKTVKNVTEHTDIRHDQVVACVYGKEFPLTHNVVGGFPAPCYDGLLSKILTTQLRLSDWEGNLPPVRSDPKYKNYIDYEKALQNWRGKSCAVVKVPNSIPVIGGKGVFLCLDNWGKPNYYSALYPYIPLSSTEDVEGKIKIDESSFAVSPTSEGTLVTGVKFSNQTPSTLFFSHMEESNQLGQILQKTYIPKDADEVGSPTNIATETSCKNVEVRSNPGDDLFASPLTGNLSYTATFSCVFNTTANVEPEDCVCTGGIYTGARCGNLKDKPCTTPPTIPDIQTCKKDIYIRLSTISSTPEVDDVWSRLVAGPMSVFKRIFPKTNTEGSVGQIIDIAGSTNITYSGEGISQSNTDLKLPHVGGISEYFLKGIQTALRPKGFGESIMFEINSIVNPDDTAICDANCNPDPTNVDLTGVKERFISVANGWFGTGNGTPRADMFDTVVAAAKGAGVDPIFTLALWIHESGASNYQGACIVRGHNDPNSAYCQAVQDFGINKLSIETKFDVAGNIIEDHFLDQLDIFIGLPNYYYELCGQKESAKCPMQYFFAMYGPTGQCNPVNSSNAYLASIKSLYSILTAQTFACYPIKLD